MYNFLKRLGVFSVVLSILLLSASGVFAGGPGGPPSPPPPIHPSPGG